MGYSSAEKSKHRWQTCVCVCVCVRGGWGGVGRGTRLKTFRIFRDIKKEHVQISGVNTIQGVFMKNSRNFHWLSWFQLWNFHQKGVSHNFEEFAGVKACFLEVPKVTYVNISVFFRKVCTGVEIREIVLTGHQLSVEPLLKSVIPFRHDVFDVLAF